jgi:hypothetical protein
MNSQQREANTKKYKAYVKEMHDFDNRNNSKSYKVVFYLKIVSAMTLGRMKQDTRQWPIYVAQDEQYLDPRVSFHHKPMMPSTLDLAISHMNGSLHNRDKINDNLVQTALQTHYYPSMGLKLVPTAIKHGLDKRNESSRMLWSHVAPINKPIRRNLLKHAKRLPTYLLSWLQTSRKIFSLSPPLQME